MRFDCTCGETVHREQKFHLSASSYKPNLERPSNSSQSTHPAGRVLWEELLGYNIYSLMFFIAYAFKGQVHVFVRAQWLSGRVLDSRPKGRGFEPHRRHCVVVLEQDTFILA